MKSYCWIVVDAQAFSSFRSKQYTSDEKMFLEKDIERNQGLGKQMNG